MWSCSRWCKSLFGLGCRRRIAVDVRVDGTEEVFHAVEGLVEVARGQLGLAADVAHRGLVVAAFPEDGQARFDQAGAPLALALLRIDPAIAATRGPRGGGGFGVNPLSGNGHCQIPF